MPLITASDLSVSFAELDVFEGISLEVSERARVGIVGPNGQGKTTLLETLVGDMAPQSGSVRRRPGLSIGYVPQTTRHMDAETLREEVMKAFAEITHIEGEIALSAAAIERADEDGRRDAERRYSDMLEAYEAAGGYDYENRLERIIAGVGLKMETLDVPVDEASGGQRTRASLAKALLAEPHPAHPRRADQLPRLRRTQLAGGVPATNVARLRRRLARPLLPRSGRDRDLGDQPRQAHRVQGELQQVPSPEGRARTTAADRVREAAAVHQEAGGLHRAIPRGAAFTRGPRQGKAPQPDGAHRGRQKRQEH